MGVAAVILLALGIPLAVVFRQSFVDAELLETQAAAARTLAEIKLPIDVAQLSRLYKEADAPPRFSVYDKAGVRRFGDGPEVADMLTLEAIGGATVSASDGMITVATPIIDRGTEQVIGAVRVSESLGEVEHRTRVAYLIIVASGSFALSIGWLVARRLAGQMSRPVIDLAASASTLGQGIPVPVSRSGIAEIDTLAAAFDDSALRVHDALIRERRFSADVSHQLRTPLTGLRLRLEAIQSDGTFVALDGALGDLVRIESTVEHLLAHARNEVPVGHRVDLGECVHAAVNRWSARVSQAGRSVAAPENSHGLALCSEASVSQILDVLIDNALCHGEGAIAVHVRPLGTGISVDVSDEGRALALDDGDAIFDRGHGRGTGIGLALARSLAELEGGRLLLGRCQPTIFSLVVLADVS